MPHDSCNAFLLISIWIEVYNYNAQGHQESEGIAHSKGVNASLEDAIAR